MTRKLNLNNKYLQLFTGRKLMANAATILLVINADIYTVTSSKSLSWSQWT